VRCALLSTSLALALALALAACGAPTPPHIHDPDALLRGQLLDAVSNQCRPIAGVTPYATDDGEAPTVTPCSLLGAVAWQSDLDVDCDGGKLASCKADPAYQPETSTTTSTGEPLDANTIPFVVVPLPGHGFDYTAQGIQLGAAAYVVFGDKLVAGVFGDEGPPDIIGEASFAMAGLLGIDNDPVTGGADAGATFIIFTGADAVVDPIEDHDAATATAKALAGRMLTSP
jgi:hypothetical protein